MNNTQTLTLPTIEVVECAVLAGLYFFILFVPLVHNVYFYVIKQKRYQLLMTSMFYTISFVIIVTRIISFVI